MTPEPTQHRWPDWNDFDRRIYPNTRSSYEALSRIHHAILAAKDAEIQRLREVVEDCVSSWGDYAPKSNSRAYKTLLRARAALGVKEGV